MSILDIPYIIINITNYIYRRKEIFYLTTHSTHFIYGYMASKVKDSSDSERGNPLPALRVDMDYSFRLAARDLLHAPFHRHQSRSSDWNDKYLHRSIMKDRSDDPSQHERMLYIQTTAIIHILCMYVRTRERDRNVLFNDALNTFYLRLYGVRHMVKDHSDSEKGNPLPPHRLLLSINSKGSFICTIPQTG